MPCRGRLFAGTAEEICSADKFMVFGNKKDADLDNQRPSLQLFEK